MIKGDNILSVGTPAGGGISIIANDPVTSGGGGGGDSPPITDNLSIYLNPDVDVYSDAGTTLAVDGDNIRQFNDQSGNSNTLNQSTAIYQPIYRTSILGNDNASIESQNDFLELTSVLDYTTTTNWTWYFVFQQTSTATTYNWFKGTSTYPRPEFWSTKTSIKADTGAARNCAYSNNTDLKMLAITNQPSNGEFKLYINGSYVSQDVNASYYSTRPLSYTIAKLFANSTYAMHAGNVLFYTDVHDATQVQEVSDWLNTKYSIY